jgi:hypothetical protein
MIFYKKFHFYLKKTLGTIGNNGQPLAQTIK